MKNYSRARLTLMYSALVMFGPCGASLHGDIVPLNSSAFGPGSTTITFNGLPVGTPIPFTIGIAQFIGLAGSVQNPGLPASALPPAPSGAPYLTSSTLNGEDVIEIVFGSPQHSVGAYFNVQGAGTLVGIVQLEAYSGSELLGIVPAIPAAGTYGGFVGAGASGAVIDRVIFRDIDPTIGISFRIDDFMFVPSPATLVVILPLVQRGRRR